MPAILNQLMAHPLYSEPAPPNFMGLANAMTGGGPATPGRAKGTPSAGGLGAAPPGASLFGLAGDTMPGPGTAGAFGSIDELLGGLGLAGAGGEAAAAAPAGFGSIAELLPLLALA